MLKADKKLVLVDNYVDVGTLNILAKKKFDVEAIVYIVRRTRLNDILERLKLESEEVDCE